MPLLGDDDLVVCHRAGYAHITPQACLDRHLRDPKACGRCRIHVHCLSTMVDATEKTAEDIVSIVRDGKIGNHSNPLVNKAAKADWENTVNTYIVFINGIRPRQGFIKEFRTVGGMTDRSLAVTISAADVDKIAKGVREIAVDELIAGRLVYRFEWNADGDNKPSESVNKENEKLFTFRLAAVAKDVFSR